MSLVFLVRKLPWYTCEASRPRIHYHSFAVSGELMPLLVSSVVLLFYQKILSVISVSLAMNLTVLCSHISRDSMSSANVGSHAVSASANIRQHKWM